MVCVKFTRKQRIVFFAHAITISMKPFHFALIALAFFLLTLVAFFVYQGADAVSVLPEGEKYQSRLAVY